MLLVLFPIYTACLANTASTESTGHTIALLVYDILIHKTELLDPLEFMV